MLPLCIIPVLPITWNYQDYSKTSFFFFFFFQIWLISGMEPFQWWGTAQLGFPGTAGSAGLCYPASRKAGGKDQTHVFGIAGFPRLKYNNCPQRPALSTNTRSCAVNKSKANPTYKQLLWKSLWARSAWQRNSSYSYAGKLLYCNCTLYK